LNTADGSTARTRESEGDVLVTFGPGDSSTGS